VSEQAAPPPSVDWHKAAQDYFGAFAHPLNPELSVRDFPTAVHLATASKFSPKSGEEGHASPIEAGLFWKEFQQLGMDPKTYLETLDKLKGLSWRLLDRPPSMSEIGMHRDATPAAIRQYYSDLPHPKYPEVPAGEFVKAMTKATYYSMEHAGRRPYEHEAAFFHASGFGASQIADHYQAMKPPDQQPSPGPQQQQ